MKTKLLAALFGIMILSCLSATVYADQINTQNQDQAIASQTTGDVEQVGTQWGWYPPPPPPPRPYPPRPYPPRPYPPRPYPPRPGYPPPPPPPIYY